MRRHLDFRRQNALDRNVQRFQLRGTWRPVCQCQKFCKCFLATGSPPTPTHLFTPFFGPLPIGFCKSFPSQPPNGSQPVNNCRHVTTRITCFCIKYLSNVNLTVELFFITKPGDVENYNIALRVVFDLFRITIWAGCQVPLNGLRWQIPHY